MSGVTGVAVVTSVDSAVVGCPRLDDDDDDAKEDRRRLGVFSFGSDDDDDILFLIGFLSLPSLSTK